MAASINDIEDRIREDIKRSKYQQIIHRVQKFIELENGDIKNYPLVKVLKVLHIQAYACSKIFFKQYVKHSGSDKMTLQSTGIPKHSFSQSLLLATGIISARQSKRIAAISISNKLVLTKLVNIMHRNFKYLFSLLSQLVDTKLILVKLMHDKKDGENYSQSEQQQNCIYGTLSSSGLSRFFQIGLWLSTQLVLMKQLEMIQPDLDQKLNEIIKQQEFIKSQKQKMFAKIKILEKSMDFLQKIRQNNLRGNNSREKAEELSIRSLYMSNLLRARQYQSSQSQGNKNILELLPLLFSFTHKSSGILKRKQTSNRKNCNKLIFLNFTFLFCAHIGNGDISLAKQILEIINFMGYLPGIRRFRDNFPIFKNIIRFCDKISLEHFQLKKLTLNIFNQVQIKQFTNKTKTRDYVSKKIQAPQKNLISSKKKSIVRSTRHQLSNLTLQAFDHNPDIAEKTMFQRPRQTSIQNVSIFLYPLKNKSESSQKLKMIQGKSLKKKVSFAYKYQGVSIDSFKDTNDEYNLIEAMNENDFSQKIDKKPYFQLIQVETTKTSQLDESSNKPMRQNKISLRKQQYKQPLTLKRNKNCKSLFGKKLPISDLKLKKQIIGLKKMNQFNKRWSDCLVDENNTQQSFIPLSWEINNFVKKSKQDHRAQKMLTAHQFRQKPLLANKNRKIAEETTQKFKTKNNSSKNTEKNYLQTFFKLLLKNKDSLQIPEYCCTLQNYFFKEEIQMEYQSNNPIIQEQNQKRRPSYASSRLSNFGKNKLCLLLSSNKDKKNKLQKSRSIKKRQNQEKNKDRNSPENNQSINTLRDIDNQLINQNQSKKSIANRISGKDNLIKSDKEKKIFNSKSYQTIKLRKQTSIGSLKEIERHSSEKKTCNNPSWQQYNKKQKYVKQFNFVQSKEAIENVVKRLKFIGQQRKNINMLNRKAINRYIMKQNRATLC